MATSAADLTDSFLLAKAWVPTGTSLVFDGSNWYTKGPSGPAKRKDEDLLYLEINKWLMSDKNNRQYAGTDMPDNILDCVKALCFMA